MDDAVRRAIRQLQDDIDTTKKVYRQEKEGSGIIKCYELAIWALKRQVPRKPIKQRNTTEIVRCRICKIELCVNDKYLFYCPKCGQKL